MERERTFRTERIVSFSIPNPRTNIPIGSIDSPENTDQQSERHVGDIPQTNGASVCNGDSPTAALWKVEVVEAGAGGDDEPE